MGIYDVCIIGGGAAGLAAAASLDDHIKTCLVEKNRILGRKLMATGGGRCNLTNAACDHKDLTLDFFASLGLAVHCDEEGRYFPYSNQASDVVRILEQALTRKDIDILTDSQVEQINHDGEKFIISHGKGTVSARRLILASGGKAAPQMGTTGDGYGFARALGHKVQKTYPVLTGIRCGDFSDIKGVRARGCVSLYRDKKLLHEERGEIQFTEDGISGICVFNISLHIKTDPGEAVEDALKRYELALDLAPDFTTEELGKRKQKTEQDSFGILPEKLAAQVPLSIIKDWRLPVIGIKGWKNAQCTAGGISLEEIDGATMESKILPNLYPVGEVIDYQGPCGGFNLQNAWETGLKAAAAINREMRGEKAHIARAGMGAEIK
ncbi:MAG: NAD(P)/FAD-dependent oxidoreductase [Bacillota bacterium]|nr:NAD(P)/FAD-dependent oxidoreductase [Bacillota bacterium]